MVNLGNAWHLPGNSEPPGSAGMRDPVFPTDPVTTVTIFSGNQYQGGGNAGNQLQDGSVLFFKQAADADWQTVPMIFAAAIDNNKYYSAPIPTGGFAAGTVVQYYLRIAYDDHDTTFLQAAADAMTTGDQAAAQAAPFTFTVETPAQRGQWGDLFTLPNVCIHAHVLPNGLVLMWGRRDNPQQSMDTDPASPLAPGLPAAPKATCTPFLWDPATGDTKPTAMPMLPDGATNANLFCSGHAFLPDGRLLVAGGHLRDSYGLNQATIYDPAVGPAGTWTPTTPMNHGRWYPTSIALPSGNVLVLGGSYFDPAQTPPLPINLIPQIWSSGVFTSIASMPNDAVADLYPRMHVASTGTVYLTSLIQTWALDVSGAGTWTQPPNVTRHNGSRDYASSVLYDVDKVLFAGGGNLPTPNAETIDLSQAQLAWQPTGAMNFPRRQHNATVLPDGTVLVTGGTRGGGAAGTAEAFNDLDPGQPVHIAELWDPKTGQWTELAAEKTDRCYHATAVLLPDGRVLSAGSGEFILNENTPQQVANAPQDTHDDAQLFSPPYLFKGPQPQITSAPATVSYGETFEIGTPQPDQIQTVSLVRLSSVTHSFNAGQRINFLASQVALANLSVTAPANANVCPPGHYLLFILNDQGVPSVAEIVQVSAPANAAPPVAAAQVRQAPQVREAPQDAFALRARVRGAATGTRAVVGIQGSCPYGIAACWGGANEALRNLDGVQYVDPVPDGESSTATVYLEDDGLPALDRWHDQFHQMVHDTYALRGVEVTVTGTVEALDGVLTLTAEGQRPAVELLPLGPGQKVQWDQAATAPAHVEPDEAAAYSMLIRARRMAGAQPVTVTGPITQAEAVYRLQVRLIE